jgi:uncharacterized membrane protein YqjE
MAHESIKGTPFARSLSDLLSDLSHLVRKELELARAEMSSKFATKAQGGIWAGAAGLFGIIALLTVVQAVVFGIASFGIALHWSCLIVAAVCLLGAAIAYWRARSDLQEDLTPTRTINQIKQDIAAAKEQWS